MSSTTPLHAPGTARRPPTDDALGPRAQRGAKGRSWPGGARARFLVVATLAYLAGGLAMWWGVWSAHPTTTGICACGDPALFLWFLTWPAHAIAHGLDPFYSTYMFHPRGVNLLANTSELALGVPLAPVTWLFGPVAAWNVALILAPVLSALSMCWLLTRWVRARFAAFVGGLLFGFSPFLFVADAGSYLMLSFLPLLPLIVGCLDELFVTQRRSPVAVGLLLAGAVTVELFVSTEILAMVVLVAALGVVVVVVGAVLVDRRVIRRKAPHALRGLGVAGVAGVALMAYPAWFAVAGPAHLGNPIWRSGLMPYGGNTLSAFWRIGYLPHNYVRDLHSLGGYQGPALPQPAFLGVGLLVVLGVGWLLWRRDRRLGFFAVLFLVTAALSLGLSKGHWTPWRLFVHLPQMDNIIPSRFSIFVTLCAAVMLGLIVDHVVGALSDRRLASPRLRPWLAGAGALAVSLVALSPVAGAEASNVPLTIRPISAPRWYTAVGAHLGPRAVVLSYPFTSSSVSSSLAWQALANMGFQSPGGEGPGAQPSEAGRDAGAVTVLALASRGGAGGMPTAANVATVRRALVDWGVTTVVVPRQAPLPLAARGVSTPYGVAFFTAVLGRGPRTEAGAFVWGSVPADLAQTPPRPLSPTAFLRCATAATAAGAAACVLG